MVGEHGERTRLVLALHFHQPHGNLDEVFHDACARCYLPTLELLAAYPQIKTAIHVSGPLLDWCEKHRPELLSKLEQLVAREQTELLGGGYQEPMLAILPDRDAVGQLQRMADRCEELLGARPCGMWLAERVWEPDLARVIARGGYGYTLLDDTHLFASGAEDPLSSYYVTDKAGATTAIFPIDRGLRTRIPFAAVDDLVSYLDDQRGRTLVYGDDAEKFGLWPTTEQRVWTNKWLERFLSALVEHDWIETVTPSRVMADSPPAGRVYLPTISYAEMGAWALPAPQSTTFSQIGRRVALAGFAAEAERYLRGGIWQGFLAKYPEANLIYRKMLRVSAAVERVRNSDSERHERARDALYRGQCNCAYWHGLFGGLYLQHLRAALMQALLDAEAIATERDHVTADTCDFDGDLRDEVVLESPHIDAVVSPARGGSVLSLELVQPRFHLTGVIGRRREAYHEDVPRARVISDEELGSVAAHDLVRATEEGLADKLVTDAHPRGAFVDHLLTGDTTPAIFDRDYRADIPLHALAYELGTVEVSDRFAVVPLTLQTDGITIAKRYELSKEGHVLSCRYELCSEARRNVVFATHIDVTLLSPDSVGGRRIEVSSAGRDPVCSAPGTRTQHEAVREVRVFCDDLGIDVRLQSSPPCELWRLPIETVSQSERGFERAYQGTALVFVWRLQLDDTAQPIELRLEA